MQEESRTLEEVLAVSTDGTFQENADELIEEIPWQETRDWLGNVYNIMPEQGMLIGKGMLILKKRSIRKLRQIVKEEFYNVRYDRDYVVAWVAMKIIKPFRWLPYNEFQKILSDAMRLLKSQEDNGLVQRKSPYKRSID